VVQLAAVVLAHTALSPKSKIKSTYLRSPWYLMVIGLGLVYFAALALAGR